MINTTSDAAEIRTKLGYDAKDTEHVSRNNKNKSVIVRAGFFYTNGQNATGFAAKIAAKLPEFHVVDCGQVWKSFIGGAPLKKQSHWWVELKRTEDVNPAPVA